LTALDQIAQELGASGRSLRRAASRGTIRRMRHLPRQLSVAPREELYVRRHWRLLAQMLQVLRTQPNVRVAVLFGSVSCGDERPDSDLDLVVRFADPSVRALSLLAGRLEEATGRSVQLVELRSAETSPLLLADVLRDGRVLVDRDGDWSRLKRREPAIARTARAEEERLTDEVAAALEELL
jgi:predicted nucleotidyltransferase